MRWRFFSIFSVMLCLAAPSVPAAEGPSRHFEAADVFQLEYAIDPQISPDGKRIVYQRVSMDIMKDKQRRNLWIIDSDGENNRPLLSGAHSYGGARWSPDGTRLAYVTAAEGAAQIYVRWMDSGQTARLTDLVEGPDGLAWSPNGKYIAFTMFVPEEGPKPAAMPDKPEGAEWAPPVKIIDRMVYRVDGAGYLETGHTQLFVISAEGGTPRQLSFGPYDHEGAPAWSPDGKSILISANRRADADMHMLNSEIYEIRLEDGATTQLTDRDGPDAAPVVSPNGRYVALTGFDDKKLGYQNSEITLMNRDGSDRRVLTSGFDHALHDVAWRADSRGLYALYEDRGVTKLAEISLSGKIATLAEDIGGTSLGRPYESGSFSVSGNNKIATVVTTPMRPAEVAVVTGRGRAKQLTALNEDLLARKALGHVEQFWTDSSAGGEKIEAWLVTPPDFDPKKKYPLILEIHGGPFANYGPRFAAEMQLYAAAGYVVVYGNPRGSTSYGADFANLIHHNYPSQDYDDLMSVTDAVVARGFIDADNLFVTGGSGGGVLTAWIVGKTDRFKAAVVAKPVINWTSFALNADFSPFFTQYWFAAMPWEDPMAYWKRSPLSLVGNVKTPTMLLTGEADYRTPISETEQFYKALKLRGVDSRMVRVPGASHGIAARPSNLIAKVENVLAWFEAYRRK